jgi:hypothetical protein
MDRCIVLGGAGIDQKFATLNSNKQTLRINRGPTLIEMRLDRVERERCSSQLLTKRSSLQMMVNFLASTQQPSLSVHVLSLSLFAADNKLDNEPIRTCVCMCVQPLELVLAGFNAAALSIL